MELTDPVLFWLVLAVALVLPLAVALAWRTKPGTRARNLTGRILGWAAILLSQVMAIGAVFLWANTRYGLFESWSDLFPAGSGPVVAPRVNHPVPVVKMPISPDNPAPRGRLETIQVPGADPFYGQVVVWLPPQYFDKAYARTRFPVLFMFHGGRGNNGQTLAKAIDAQNLNMSVIDSGHATPFIAVYGPPNIRVGTDSECVDLPGIPAQTWMVKDLAGTIASRYRISTSHRRWFVSGWSTGGYCAAVLLARHPAMFQAGVAVGGYYTPVFDDPAVLGGNQSIVTDNSVLDMVRTGKLRQLPLMSIMSTHDPQSWGDGGRTTDAGQVLGTGQWFYQAARDLPGTAWELLDAGGHQPGTYLPHMVDMLRWLGAQGL